LISTANIFKEGTRKRERLIKVCLHEMGHNFGLPHCESGDKKCLMRSANGTVKTIDEEEKYLCTVCSGILKTKGFKLRNFS
jgi:archaemetzincin